jgi:hypothetical protein
VNLTVGAAMLAIKGARALAYAALFSAFNKPPITRRLGRAVRFCSVFCRDNHNRAVRPTRYSITRDELDERLTPSIDERLSTSVPERRARLNADDDDQSTAPAPNRSSQGRFSAGVTTRRRQATADQARERAAWEVAHPEVNLTRERERYRSEIMPRLVCVTFSVRDLADALGLSLAYAARIRSGEIMPHPRYFPKIQRLVEISASGRDEEMRRR